MKRPSVGKVERFSVSLEAELLKKFENYINKNGHPNRSEALRILIKRALVEDEWSNTSQEVVGVVSLTYDHHRRGLVDKLIRIQHDDDSSTVRILATLHIHLDHDNCLEVIGVSGLSSDIKNFYSHLKSVKGLKHISLTPATRGKNLL